MLLSVSLFFDIVELAKCCFFWCLKVEDRSLMVADAEGAVQGKNHLRSAL